MSRAKVKRKPNSQIRARTKTPSVTENLSPQAASMYADKKLTDKECNEFRSQFEKISLLEMELGKMTSEYRHAVATKFNELGVPISSSALCLTCGKIRPVSQQQCPECKT